MTSGPAEPEADLRTRLRGALASTTARLAGVGIESASVDARALISRAARTERPLVLLDALPEDFDRELARLTERRAAREPLQLVLGEAPFRHLLLAVRAGVFTPRPETEVAIDLVLEHARGAEVREVLDLCTGGGALAAAVLDELPGAQVIAVELDPQAAALARENLDRAARRDGGGGPGGRGCVLEADVTDAGALAGLGPVDVVVSNPPYIPAGAVPRDPEVTAWDPARALYGGGADGLTVPRAVLARAAELLRPGGLLVMEHADVQGAATRRIAEESGAFLAVRTAMDLTGRDRFLVARRAPRVSGDDRAARK